MNYFKCRRDYDKVPIIRVTLTFLFIALCAIVQAQPANILWSENWEGNWSNVWHADAGTWNAGIPTSGPNSAYQGQNCSATVLDGNYAEPVDSRLIRHISFTVPSASENPRLRFWHWYRFSTHDYGQVQIKVGSGAWEKISTNYTNTGSSVWTYPSIDLSAYADSTVQIAFYFHSHRTYEYGSSGNVSSGWYIDDIAVITGPIQFNTFENFESGLGDWYVERGTWEVGMFATHSGENGAATVLGGSYAEPVDSRLISPEFIVPSSDENPRLRFWHKYSFSTHDYGQVQIKVGDGAWQSISTNYTNTGSAVWTYPSIDLSAYADSTVQIAFYFHSHRTYEYGSSANVSWGWLVDEVSIIIGPIQFNTFEDFESGLGDWYVERGTWEVGMFATHSGENGAATVIGGSYAEPVDSRFISPEFIVPGSDENPRLRFWHRYSFSTHDYGRIQVKVNGGSWQSVSPQYTSSSSNVWTYPSIDLSAYADSSIQIAFYFHSHRTYEYGSSANVSWGWLIDEVSIITGAIQLNNPTNFESGIDDWSAERGTWQIGEPTTGPDSAYSGPNCAATVLAGNYYEPVDSRLISPPLTVPSVKENPSLRFRHWYSFSTYDYGYVQIKTAHGDWTTISNNYVNTSSNVWTYPYFDLSTYADSTIQIAFNFHSNRTYEYGSSGNVSTGWYIDDIYIVGLTYPLIQVEPDSINFEYVQEDSTETKSALIRNIGTDTLHLNSIYIEGKNQEYFSVDTSLFSLAPSDSQLLQVSFNPTSIGNFSASLYVYSNGGAEIVILSGMAIEDTVTNISDYDYKIPNEFSLRQNYPNPFNPVTTIQYQLPKGSDVLLRIYNSLGQKITTLVNEQKPAGYYNVTWDAGNLASGVYFYILEAESFRQIKKMLLIK